MQSAILGGPMTAPVEPGIDRVRPPKPDEEALRRVGPDTPLVRARHLVEHALLNTIDRVGFELGLIPPRVHVVICGFPRSGTTLLHLMVQTAIPGILAFRRERFGLRVARMVWPGRHPFMVTKRPADLFWIDEIRQDYRARVGRAD